MSLLYQSKMNKAMGLKDLSKKKAGGWGESEYVGVRRNRDGSFTPQRITAKVYGSMSEGGLHSPVSRIKAAFKLSSEPLEWTLDGGSVAYVEGIVMSRDASIVIFDVLHDFMVISCMERGFEVMRLKDAVLADYLSEEEDYRLCGKAGRYSYFEVDVKNFE